MKFEVFNSAKIEDLGGGSCKMSEILLGQEKRLAQYFRLRQSKDSKVY